MNEKDKEKGEVLGGSNDGDLKNYLIRKMAGMMMMWNILPNMLMMEEMLAEVKVVAVVHGVHMVPFHMNIPALMGWQKGGMEKSFLEKVTQAKEL